MIQPLRERVDLKAVVRGQASDLEDAQHLAARLEHHHGRILGSAVGAEKDRDPGRVDEGAGSSGRRGLE